MSENRTADAAKSFNVLAMPEITTQINNDGTTTVWGYETIITNSGKEKKIQTCKIIPGHASKGHLRSLLELRRINRLPEREKFITNMEKYRGSVSEKMRQM